MSWDALTPPPPSALLAGVVVSALLLLISGATVVQSSPLQPLQQQQRLAGRPHHHRSFAGNSSIEERMLRIEEIKNRIRESFGAIPLRPSAAAKSASVAAAGLTEEDRRRVRAELRLREMLAGGGEEGERAGRRGGDAAADGSPSLDLFSFRPLEGGAHDDGGRPGDDSARFRFAVNIPPYDEAGRRNRIESAMLHLYKEAVRPRNLNDSLNVAANVVVSVHQLLANGLRRLVGARVVSLAERGWFSLDVTEAVQSWLDEPLSNHGLLVDAPPPNDLSALLDFASGGSSGGSSSSGDDQWSAYNRAPLLDVRVYQQQQQSRKSRQSPARTRERREAGDAGSGTELLVQQQQPFKRPGSSRRAGTERCAPGQCCRRRLSISFADDLGWTWVVEPKTFDAYYCEGGCVGNYKAANYFAEVKKALRRGSPGLRNRCAPTRYKSLTVAHYDEGGDIALKEMRDMIVDECGCA